MTGIKPRTIWIGLGVFVCLVCLAVAITIVVWRYLAVLIPQIGSPAATAITGVIGSVLTLVVTKTWDRSREIQQEHRRQKTPLYKAFIAFLFKVLMSSKTGSPLTEAEMMGFMVKFTKGLTIWGSNDVIKKYGEFRRLSQANPTGVALAEAIENILFSIRKDLGHPSGLQRGDLLRLFINDMDTYLPES